MNFESPTLLADLEQAAACELDDAGFASSAWTAAASRLFEPFVTHGKRGGRAWRSSSGSRSPTAGR